MIMNLRAGQIIILLLVAPFSPGIVSGGMNTEKSVMPFSGNAIDLNERSAFGYS
jgi:hypothetical protein